MHVYARNLKSNSKKKRTTKSSSGSFWSIALAIQLIVLAAAVIGVLSLRIYYNAEVEQLSRESSRTKFTIHRLEREIVHLKLRKENLCRWPHISKKISDYQLGLKSPSPNQVRVMVVRNRQRADRTETGPAVASNRR